ASRQRLGEPAKRQRAQGVERARRDQLGPEDEHHVWVERPDALQERVVIGAGAEVEERGAGPVARLLQRALEEVARLSHDREAQELARLGQRVAELSEL